MTFRISEQPRPSDINAPRPGNVAQSRAELAKPLNALSPLKLETADKKQGDQKNDRLRIAQEFIGSRPAINFETDFHLQQSLEYFHEQDPRNPDQVALIKAQRLLEPLGKIDIMDKNKQDFMTELDSLSAMYPAQLGAQMKNDLIYAYERHQALKEYLKKISTTKTQFDQSLEEVKPVKDPESIPAKMTQFKNEVIDTFFNKMSGKEQFAAVGFLIGGLALIAQAEPETNYYLYRFKETLLGMGKLGLLGIGINSGVALFNNGKSIWDMLEEKKPRIDTKAYWTKHFPSAPEETNKLVLFGADMPALEMIKQYREAKKGSQEVETGINPDKLPPAQAYKALEAIVKKYDKKTQTDQNGKTTSLTLEEKYGKREPPITLYELLLAEGLRTGDIAFSEKKINEAKAKAAGKGNTTN